MANKYVFNRDSIIVNGRTFPAQYAVMLGACASVEILVEVDGGEMARISVPPSDRQYTAALQAAQMGLTLDAATAPDDGGSASRDGDSVPGPAADRVQADDSGSASRDGDSVPGGDVPGPAADNVPGAAAVEAGENAPEMAAEAPEAALETVDNETTAAEAVKPSDAVPADVETVNAAAVDNVPADVETVQAAAEDAETINNEEVNTMNKQINTAAEAVKAAAAAEVQEMTTAAEVDPKATRGPVPEKTFRNEVIAGNGWSIVFDSGCNRTRVIIAEPVKAAARPIVEEAGFYYSKALDSWNKKLTFRAYRAAQSLAEKLRAALA